MDRMPRRRVVVILVVGILAALLAPGSASGGAAAGTSRMTGTLLVSPDEDGSGRVYALARKNGDLVPVQGERLSSAVPGSIITVDVVASRTGTPTVQSVVAQEAPPAAAGEPAVHRVFLAAPSNLGTFSSTDAAMLDQLRVAADFWVDEADGAILDLQVPTTITRYAASVATDANNCGLDNDFFAVMDEAAAVFPEADFVAGTDHLVLLGPSQCASTGTAGRALLGDSLADGGFQVTFMGSPGVVGTLAHEWGHNFGLMHSNIGACDEFDCYGEYANLYNVMGRGTLPSHNRLTALSTAFRSIAGLIATDEVVSVPVGDGSTEVTFTRRLAPRSGELESELPRLRALSVLDPDTGQRLFIEYRSGTLQDAGSAYALGYDHGSARFEPGVVIEHADDRAVSLQVTNEATSFDGTTWTNGSGTLSVAAGPIASGGVDVTVTYTPGDDWSGPLTASIEGEPVVDRSLFVQTNAWGAVYQWLVDGEPAAGADSYDFQVAPEHRGSQVAVAVTEYEYGKGMRTVVSAPVTIRPGDLGYYDEPTIFGTAAVGRTLTTNGAIWGDPSFDGPTATTLQWWSGGTAVPGATGTSYVVRPEDAGNRITVSDTGTRAGYTTLTLTSAPTAVVPTPPLPPLPDAPTPVIDGTPQVDQPLTAVTGTWPPGTTLSYQWLHGTGPIADATGPTYTPKASDVGLWIKVRVTGTKPGFQPTTRTSQQTASVVKGRFAPATPTVTGRAKVGKRLRAVPGTWTPEPTFRYQWKANGRNIRGARGATLVLKAGQRGKRISVRVTGSRPGYTTVSRTSAATARVRG